MIIKSFSDSVVLPTKRDVLRIQLYTKLIQFSIQPFETDIDIIIELYCFGGYNEDTQKRFFDICLEKKYKKTEQSIRNTLSKYTALGVLEKPKNRKLFVNPKFIPVVECDLLVLRNPITHADGLQTNLSGTSPKNREVGTDV